MTSTVPLHIFLSYSRKDEKFVNRLRKDLESSNIPVWIDTRNIVPGTPNWELAIRGALHSSYALVLVGSPTARDSKYVQAELAIAESNKLPIIPIWAAGESWAESAPLSVVQTQHIDVREANYRKGTKTLVQRLKEIMSQRKPKHTLVKDAFAGWYDGSNNSLGWGVASYIAVQLDEPPYNKPKEERLRQEEVLLFDPNAYKSFQTLLDDLYINYLQDKFAPLTYGAEWLLEERTVNNARGTNPRRLLVPWKWLMLEQPEAIFDYEPDWLQARLDHYGITEGSVWTVSNPNSLKHDAYGIAVNNEELLDVILYSKGKQPHPLHRAGLLEIVPVSRIDPLAFKYLLVVLDIWSRRPFAGQSLRETGKPWDEKFLVE